DLRASHSFPTRRSSDLDSASTVRSGLVHHLVRQLAGEPGSAAADDRVGGCDARVPVADARLLVLESAATAIPDAAADEIAGAMRSEEHTSELQSRFDLV